MDNSASWRTAYATVIGSSHIESDSPCQDYSLCKEFRTKDDASVLVAVVSDGAGSVTHSLEGARLACDLFVTEIASMLERNGDLCFLDREWFIQWHMGWKQTILDKATASGYQMREYACTFLATVIGPNEAFFIQLGDGAIVVRDTDNIDTYKHIFWPNQYEYANVTDLLTDENATEKIQFNSRQGYIDEVALFSDGLQRIALQMHPPEVHSPFFSRFFSPLRNLTPDLSEAASLSLNNLLSSECINEHTDDDKSLIIATRYSAAEYVENAEKE